jgi:dihydrolipoamide dehydrogenase
VKVGKFPFSALGRAQSMGDTNGLVKIVSDPGDGTVLGMAVMGPHASDLIAEGALAVQMKVKAIELAHTIHTHPTLPEATQEAALGAAIGGYVHYGS